MNCSNFLSLGLFVYLLNQGCSVQPTHPVPDEYKPGQTHYHKICANCHGPDARGGNRAPRLIQEVYYQENFSNGKFANTILNGSKSGAMPSQKGRVSDQEIREIIKYIRHLQKTYRKNTKVG